MAMGGRASRPAPGSSEFKDLCADLLKEWCDGMIRHQIIDPDDPAMHGALACPACEHIHGRCMDAVYPFLHMADRTGDPGYLDAAIRVMDWAEHNVSQADGSWSVVAKPGVWTGITVFGAIALAEALYYHAHMLDEEIRSAWKERLGRAADFVHDRFDMTFTNINYGFTGVFALNLFGRVLEKPAFTRRSREMAAEAKRFLTRPNKLVWGEAKPIDRRSDRGLYGVDLGYNVEESLNGVVMYALLENDHEMLGLLEESLAGHMEFMLPDGAWDNTFGTRHYKWSYWGSRTTDGCQVGYAMMADRNPVFGTVAHKSTQLLKACTDGGLLHGGPHYVSHGIKPCIHHTFTHAKPLAAVLDAGHKLPEIAPDLELPRDREYGVREFPEILTRLVSKGPWRGTVTAYDMMYLDDRTVQQATGGSLALLFHQKAGLLFAASLARYEIIERFNQQTYHGDEFPLTPRIEVIENGEWFTNLWDLEAEVSHLDENGDVRVSVKTSIRNENRKKLPNGRSDYHLDYIFKKDELEIRVKPANDSKPAGETALVLPVASVRTETIARPSPSRLEIAKENGILVMESNVPLHVRPMTGTRVFNLVPGIEAVPVYAALKRNGSDGTTVIMKII